MARVQRAMQSASDGINGAFKGMVDSTNMAGDAFSKLHSRLLIVAGVVAGGKFFKDAIDGSNKLTGEVMNLARRLGITGEQAAALNTALGDIYSDSDTYIATFEKFAKQLKTNESGLQAMGLQTRDANGNLRDSNELYMQALRSVSDYAPGLDQTTAAMTLFGKGVDDVIKLQRLNSEVIEEAKKKNEELGLSLTGEGVAASKAYKAAMNDVGDVMLAVQNTVGKAVMPVFTEMGVYFAEHGPAYVEVFKQALTGLMAVFRGIEATVKTVFEAIFEVVSAGSEIFSDLGEEMSRLFSGDFAGAAEIDKRIGARMNAVVDNIVNNTRAAFADGSEKIGSDMDRIWSKGTAVSAPSGGAKHMGDFGKTNERKGTGDSGLMASLETELMQKRVALEQQGALEDQFRGLSKAAELAFWQDKLTRQGLSQKDSAAITRKIAEVELATVRENLAAKLGALNTEAAEYKTNTEEKLRIERQVQAMYEVGTQQYEASQRRIVAIKREAAAQDAAAAQIRATSQRQALLTEVTLQEQAAQADLQLGIITQAQHLQLQAQFEAKRYEIALAALQERQRLAALDPDKNVVELARINAEIEQLQREHQVKLGQIQGAARVNQLQPVADVFRSSEQAIGQSISGILNRTMTMRGAMINAYQGMAKGMLQALTEYMAKRAAAWLVERGMTMLGIGTDAVKAGTGAAASQASIPVIGPMLALGAMATIFAAVSAMGNKVPSHSAAGGFSIGKFQMPLVQTHPEEMILPATLSNTVRDMAQVYSQARGAGQGTGQGGDVNLSVRGASMGEFFMVHRSDLVKAIKTARRDMQF